MGACGCGDFSPDFKLLAPDGDVYTISVYTGCDDCATPTGLTVNRMSTEEAERWGLDMVPEFPMPNDLGTFGHEGSHDSRDTNV